MKLVLNTGKEFDVLDTSNEYCVLYKGTSDVAKEMEEQITTETLKNGTLGEISLGVKILENLTLGQTDDGDAFVTVSMRDKTQEEELQERLNEYNLALVELAALIGGK